MPTHLPTLRDLLLVSRVQWYREPVYRSIRASILYGSGGQLQFVFPASTGNRNLTTWVEQVSDQHRSQFLDCHKSNRNNSFTINEIYHKGYHIYTRVLLPERPILGTKEAFIRQQQQQQQQQQQHVHVCARLQYAL